MKIAFRADASTLVGAGHVVRCLALAMEACARGVRAVFVCRDHVGHLAGYIQSHGFQVCLLPRHGFPGDEQDSLADPSEFSQVDDAVETLQALKGERIDCVVVDHYHIDFRWEEIVMRTIPYVSVIDDLANRSHKCQILIDQAFGESYETRYSCLIPEDCLKLLGPRYALLRAEFHAMRATSLNRRRGAKLDRLLICMGGGDPTNEVAKALAGVCMSNVKLQHIDVVVGQSYSFTKSLLQQVESSDRRISLHVSTNRMAELMMRADLAITSGGGVSWEKCVLGLPSITVVLGGDQHYISLGIASVGAHILLGMAENVSVEDYAKMLNEVKIDQLELISENARSICDGLGAKRVLDVIFSEVV
ncbi:MAG TPA: UDP-2,4-diacetamido-2,4,6-trideoxy-beta-L-altropyranose hydrolase [Burkholderiaceae bacterium]|nr:UDP-2,4-diacetamido-2,4,6-trideoxy-beta-L-altropyranose hydrolase [Burkholderiaceae bacterium]